MLSEMGGRIQLQQRNCSRFPRDFSRRSTDQPRNLSGSNSQRTGRQVAACASALKIYLSPSPNLHLVNPKNLNFLVTGGAGFIGSNLVLALQEKYPSARLTVIDDFRSGDFKNVRGYRGDFVAADLASLDWRAQFGEEKFDCIFHLASITDTTLHDQFPQVHDNVEGFRRLLGFAQPNRTPVVYASSAATYGAASGLNREADEAAPANVYAFSKVVMDNLARRAAADDPGWKIVGLRYFNVYGPREAHKGVPASMGLHLSRPMKTRQRPRHIQNGGANSDVS